MQRILASMTSLEQHAHALAGDCGLTVQRQARTAILAVCGGTAATAAMPIGGAVSAVVNPHSAQMEKLTDPNGTWTEVGCPVTEGDSAGGVGTLSVGRGASIPSRASPP